jgi:hypothetical protein
VETGGFGDVARGVDVGDAGAHPGIDADAAFDGDPAARQECRVGRHAGGADHQVGGDFAAGAELGQQRAILLA